MIRHEVLLFEICKILDAYEEKGRVRSEVSAPPTDSKTTEDGKTGQAKRTLVAEAAIGSLQKDMRAAPVSTEPYTTHLVSEAEPADELYFHGWSGAWRASSLGLHQSALFSSPRESSLLVREELTTELANETIVVLCGGNGESPRCHIIPRSESC